MDHDFSKRVGGLESDVKRLSENVSGLESDVKNVIRVVTDVSDSMRYLTSKVTDSHKTDWQAIAGVAGVLVAVMSTIGLMAIEPYKRMTEDNLKDIKDHKQELMQWRLKHINETHRMEIEYLRKQIKNKINP